MAIFGYLTLAFKVWMFVDALRRRVPFFWYLVLTFPFGEVIYFAAVKARDFGVRPGAPEEERKPSPVVRLERVAEESPSFHNRTQLAWALMEEKQPERAQHYFELALTTHPGDREALFGLGLSKLEQEDYAAAIATLTELVDESFSYEDYDAALGLVEALYQDGQREGAFELLERIVRTSHRIEHLVALARYQMRAERRDEARVTLERAIEDFEAQSEFLRRRNGAVATEARQMLRALTEEHEE